MTDQSLDYIAFLLRLWRIDEGNGVQWRASLEEPSTGARRGFANIDRLCEFLREHCPGSDDDLADDT